MLSQWRGYAGGIGGYALGFSWDSVLGHTYAFHPESTAAGTSGFPAELRPIIYGEAAAVAAADTAIKALVDAKAEGRLWTTPQGLDHRMLATNLFRVVAIMKHHAFEEEHEWRLFSPSEVRYPINVRARTSGLVPYIEIGVNHRGDEETCSHPTIADLVVGPGPEQAGQVVAARELLRATGHSPDVVRPSEAPFRG